MFVSSHNDRPESTFPARFSETGFEEIAFELPGPDQFSVGAHQFTGQPRPLPDPPQRRFTFAGYDTLLSR